MSDSLLTLTPLVSSDLHDPSNLTFSATQVGDIINSALAEIGRICPPEFREDITTVSSTVMDYILQHTIFPTGSPLVRAFRVEAWDASVTPNQYITQLRPASQEYVSASATGWECRNGILTLTNSQLYNMFQDIATPFLRVWGYGAYPLLDAAGTVTVNLPVEHHYALRVYARVEALRDLTANRELFAQWQSQSHATDITPAQLYQMLNLAQAEWRTRSRALMSLREQS